MNGALRIKVAILTFTLAQGARAQTPIFNLEVTKSDIFETTVSINGGEKQIFVGSASGARQETKNISSSVFAEKENRIEICFNYKGEDLPALGIRSIATVGLAISEGGKKKSLPRLTSYQKEGYKKGSSSCTTHGFDRNGPVQLSEAPKEIDPPPPAPDLQPPVSKKGSEEMVVFKLSKPLNLGPNLGVIPLEGPPGLPEVTDKSSGEEVLANFQAKLKYSEKLCLEKKKPNLCDVLGEFYLSTMQNAEKAIVVDTIACDANIASACTRLAQVFCKQKKTADYIKSVTKACELKSGGACNSLGVHLFYGKQRERGLETLKKGCDLGELQSCSDMSFMQYESGDFEKANAGAKIACEKGLKEACFIQKQLDKRVKDPKAADVELNKLRPEAVKNGGTICQ